MKKWNRKPGGFGRLRRLPSGRFQASYTGLDGTVHKAEHTFEFEDVAERWLEDQKHAIRVAELTGEAWQSPKQQEQNNMTVAELIELHKNSTYIRKGKTLKRKDTTKRNIDDLVSSRIARDDMPGFEPLANERVKDVDRKRIRRWWTEMETVFEDQKPTNKNSYSLLHAAFDYAVTELEIISENPVQIKGASGSITAKNKDISDLKPQQVSDIAHNMPERVQFLVWVQAYAGLRIGEALELRRGDLEDRKGVMTVKVTRNAQYLKDPVTKKHRMVTVNTPKSEAGEREIILPRKIAIKARAHLKQFVGEEADSFVFTNNKEQRLNTRSATLYFKDAAKAAGRPEITTHRLRNYYATKIVNGGEVTLEEAKRLLGHSSIEQTLKYQVPNEDYREAAASYLDGLIS